MSIFDGIEAQATAVAILERALATGRLASSYLFEGPSGVGKERAAMALADHVVGTDDKSRERIHAGSHPDVRVFRPRDEGRRNIPVDQLRQQILPVASSRPSKPPRPS